MLEIIHLKSEREQLKQHITKVQKYGFYKEPLKRYKSLQAIPTLNDGDDVLAAYRLARANSSTKNLKLTTINPKHIESHIKDFEHLFALHKKTDYIKTIRKIEDVKKIQYIGEEMVN